ncbi:MAG: hypothetical protein GXP54_13845 [Deltaproteobacteria bacterium]|nr:hypothetical protein [Deltaproteobacteria bacterium]
MKRLFGMVITLAAVFAMTATPALAQKKGGGVKSKFYDFSDQLIDGEIKKPTTLYTDARQRVKFDRLLSLKKSFMQPMLQTAKEQVFK